MELNLGQITLISIMLIIGTVFTILYLKPKSLSQDRRDYEYKEEKTQNEQYKSYFQMIQEIETVCPNCDEIKEIVKEALDIPYRGEKLLLFKRQEIIVEKEKEKLETLRMH